MGKVATLQQIDSIILSDYILKHYGPMSHLKLQKLLFYCDAYCLAYFREQLLNDSFEAWVHGPVSRKVYDNLRDKSILYSDLEYSENGIDVDYEFGKLSSEKQEIVEIVLSSLSKWTGLQLEAATHKELPWIEGRAGCAPADKCSNIISKETTKKYYAKEINGWQ